MERSRHDALLLVGPTGSGKSPLGAELERQCGWLHFDFGARLRAIDDSGAAPGLDAGDVDFVRGLLEANALFPDDAFPLVERIYLGALQAAAPARGVVLNGLPRTVSQARAMERHVRLLGVVELVASADVLRRRITRRRIGLTSDHALRRDDTQVAVGRKLAIFARETRPLVEHCRERCPVVQIDVDVATTERELARQVRLRLPIECGG